MKQKGKYMLFTRQEFSDWLFKTQFNRKVTHIQNHHTAQPDYADFHDNNHFSLLEAMEAYHVKNRGFVDIAQNLTTFPDGLIAVCRPFDINPAGIKGANTGAICIENLGNFDSHVMTEEHKKTIIFVNAMLCKRFLIPADTEHIIYHHWYGLNTGIRCNGIGIVKSCPGSKFFGGNSVCAAQKYFIPLVLENLKLTFDEALDIINNKITIDKAYWLARKAIDPYFEALIIKIASTMQ